MRINHTSNIHFILNVTEPEVEVIRQALFRLKEYHKDTNSLTTSEYVMADRILEDIDSYMLANIYPADG